MHNSEIKGEKLKRDDDFVCDFMFMMNGWRGVF
jgi:hypothetical protein